MDILIIKYLQGKRNRDRGLQINWLIFAEVIGNKNFESEFRVNK